MSPKPKTTIGRQAVIFLNTRFSSATKAIVNAISGSTTAADGTMTPLAASARVAVCATVKPLIAFTIAFVALENLVFRKMTAWRPVVVFGFGLIHGLGFAGFFGELGLPPGQFWSALIGFNLGVEIGQLTVIVAAALVGALLRRRLHDVAGEEGYRRYVALPGSLAIGITGLWWGVTRLIA